MSKKQRHIEEPDGTVEEVIGYKNPSQKRRRTKRQRLSKGRMRLKTVSAISKGIFQPEGSVEIMTGK